VTLANGSQLTPRAAIGWRHAYGDTKPDADLTFIDGGASFSTQGVPIAKDSALLEAGIDFQVTPTGKLGIGYWARCRATTTTARSTSASVKASESWSKYFSRPKGRFFLHNRKSLWRVISALR
jgi:outer membrane autotransporter protein